MVLFIGLGSAFCIAFFWARAMRKSLSLERETRFGWAQVGDIIEERFRLVNKSSFPALWIEMVDHSTIPGDSLSRATGVGGRSTNEWIAHQVCARRGVYTLGPTTLRTGDPFGIFTIQIEHSAQANILVTPPVVPLPTIQVASGGRSGEGRPSRQSIDQSISTTGVREYVPGDTLRWVHWRTTARRDSLYVRTFEHTPASDWWILLDLDRRVQVGSGNQSTEEIGVILAASLASQGLKSGIAVGLVTTGQDLVWLPPQPGEGQRWEILQTLARVTPGDFSLAALLTNAGQDFHSRISLVIITPSMEQAWLDEITHLLWRGVVPTILLLDPAAFASAPSAGPFKAALDDLDVANYLITPALVESFISGKNQPENAWDWRILPTGKAVPVQKPKDLAWKSFG
ncbi:MAG TPA: DUF58 domain-containing protein [Anaerolineaceae bacterium]|nr:DUF58 domain-containing protein [Anaerolineaceae bacterium]